MEQIITSPAIEFLLNPPEVVSLWQGEDIPASLGVGFDALGKLDADWIWVAKKGGTVVGVILASPCHGAAAIWRVAVTEEASRVCVIRLLRSFLRDIRSRGCVGYVTLIQPAQYHLAEIMRKTGAISFGSFVLLASPMPKEGL